MEGNPVDNVAPTLEELYIACADTYLIYDHGADGKHNGAVRADQESIGYLLAPIVARAMHEKRTVIVTDTGDMCLYHLENGVLVFPTAEDVERAQQENHMAHSGGPPPEDSEQLVCPYCGGEVRAWSVLLDNGDLWQNVAHAAPVCEDYMMKSDTAGYLQQARAVPSA